MFQDSSPVGGEFAFTRWIELERPLPGSQDEEANARQAPEAAGTRQRKRLKLCGNRLELKKRLVCECWRV